MSIYGYARISTSKQSIERQVRNIEREYPGAVIIREAYTGTKLDRKEWGKLFSAVQAGDTIVFDSVSRMSRNAEDGFSVYEELYRAVAQTERPFQRGKSRSVLHAQVLYRNIQRSRFKETMGRKLEEIKKQEWQDICNRESRLCQPKTLKNAWGFISSVVYEETGVKPPKVKLPQIVHNERPFLEPEQIRPFIEAVHGTDVEIPAQLALSSLRRSEIMALRWKNVDLEKKNIKVRGAAVPDEHHLLTQKKENKNATSARNVPIMIDELRNALRLSRKDSGLVVECNANTVWNKINSICEKSGFPNVGIHGLRHSFVSLACHLGVPEKIVMEIGGWADYQTMRNIYTHIARSDVAKYAEQFSGFFSGAV